MNNMQISDFPIPVEKSEIGNQRKVMPTQKQLKANRLNANRSTGPTSDEGKKVIAQNALKHGVFSKQVLLDGESKKDFEALKREFYDQFQPQGLLERLFWERALTAAWRLSRVTQMESMLINHAAKKSFNNNGIIQVLSGYEGDELGLLSRYEITLEKILFRSLGELRALQNARKLDQAMCISEIGFVSQKCKEMNT
jgi:hypothetical protein